jgi:DNA-binding response OmpR family regulator
MSQILIVSGDGDDIGLTNLVNVLNAAGYSATGASSFEEAKHVLADETPDLVIADQRLGAYNGLHIIMRARAEHPDVSAIVTTAAPDRGLEADARGLNVACMVKPAHAAEWLEPIRRTLHATRATGCAPAAPIPVLARSYAASGDFAQRR